MATNVTRRRFLTTLTLGGAAAGLAVAGRQGGEAKDEKKAAAQGRGYRLTEHIRKYYETAKV
jgi:hypothetical protein